MAKKEEQLMVVKERVLEAAKECPDTKRVLKKLFPEAFEEKELVLYWVDVGMTMTAIDCILYAYKEKIKGPVKVMLCGSQDAEGYMVVIINGPHKGSGDYLDMNDIIDCVMADWDEDAYGSYQKYLKQTEGANNAVCQYELATIMGVSVESAIKMIKSAKK